MSRDPHHALMASLTDYLGPLEDVVAKTRDWSSATFSGMVHDVTFTCAASPMLLDALPDIDLPMNCHFVADLRVTSTHRDDRTRIGLEVLTIRE
jgi:hypothetical protein